MSRHTAVVLCCTLGMLACSPDTPKQSTDTSAAPETATASSVISARVNQQVITQSQVDERVALLSASPTMHLRVLALRQLMDESLVVQAAEAAGMNSVVRNAGKEKTAHGGVALRSALLHAMVEKSIPEMSADDVSVWVSRQKGAWATDAVAVSGVLMSVPRDGDALAWLEAEARAQKLKAWLAAGEISLAVAVSRYSDHESARRQGRLGGVSQSRYPSIHRALAGRPVGSLAGPVRTEDGFWVVRKDAEPPVTRMSVGPMAEQVTAHLRRQSEVQAMSARLLELRAQAELSVETAEMGVPDIGVDARAPVMRVPEDTLPASEPGQPVLPGALYRAPPSHHIRSNDRDGGAR